MKHLYLFFCLALLSLSSNAQTKAKTMELGNVISDSTSVNRELGLKLGLASINGSNSVIEIRLYSNIGFPGAECVVLQYDKTWTATKYKLDAKDAVVKSVFKPVGGVDPLVRSMIAFNLFSLPTQKSLNQGNYKLDLATNEVKASAITVSDAPCYTVQFKVGNNSREYKYCDPKSYAAFYKRQHEYLDFAGILKIVAKLEAK
jgi:hypothetical protein